MGSDFDKTTVSWHIAMPIAQQVSNLIMKAKNEFLNGNLQGTYHTYKALRTFYIEHELAAKKETEFTDEMDDIEEKVEKEYKEYLKHKSLWEKTGKENPALLQIYRREKEEYAKALVKYIKYVMLMIKHVGYLPSKPKIKHVGF